jgi:adenylylsulfate reductase subunit B
MKEKCDGCKGQDRTACMHICPQDLMFMETVDSEGKKLPQEKLKAYNRDPSLCWECYNCVKICPQQAVDVRGYADFIPLGASCTPLRGSDTIMWTVKFRDPEIKPKRFKFPIRTTAEGTAQPQGGFESGPSVLGDQLLATEPVSLRLSALPTAKR